jgi:hypothetical protein
VGGVDMDFVFAGLCVMAADIAGNIIGQGVCVTDIYTQYRCDTIDMDREASLETPDRIHVVTE